MKTKKLKYVEDLLDDYITLLDEQINLPILIEKANEKYTQHVSEYSSYVYKPDETDDMFKIFMQIKKHEERKKELNEKIAEIEITLIDFLSFLKGGKITYEKKSDDKSKPTFLFWPEDGKVMCNR